MAFNRVTDPWCCPGTYTLDLYCDHDNDEHEFQEFPHEVSGHETGSAARAAARRWGWKLHPDGTATCPKCIARLKRTRLTTPAQMEMN